MKRYIAIDMTALKKSNLSLLEWCILENIKFLSHDDKWCYASKKSLAKHHAITERGFFKIRKKLELEGWLKSNSKGYIRTTKKWYEQSSDYEQSSYEQSSDEGMNKVPIASIKEDNLSVDNIYLTFKKKIKSVKPNFNFANEKEDKKQILDAMEKDGRSEAELIGCINYIYSDRGSFWIPHILTGKKLREKFDTIEMQMMKPRVNNGLDKIIEEVENEENRNY